MTQPSPDELLGLVCDLCHERVAPEECLKIEKPTRVAIICPKCAVSLAGLLDAIRAFARRTMGGGNH